MLLLTYLYFCDAVEKLGEVWKLWQESATDPLLDEVDFFSQTGGLLEMSSSELAMF
jgi:hypothetical protein